MHGYLSWGCISFEFQKHFHPFPKKSVTVFFFTGKGVDALSFNPLEVAAFPMYDIKGIQSSLTMLYYVSINGNSWNVKMHLDDEPPTYREMLLSSHPADDSWHDDDLGFGLKYQVFMSTSREAILIIKIYKSK